MMTREELITFYQNKGAYSFVEAEMYFIRLFGSHPRSFMRAHYMHMWRRHTTQATRAYKTARLLAGIETE